MMTTHFNKLLHADTIYNHLLSTKTNQYHSAGASLHKDILRGCGHCHGIYMGLTYTNAQNRGKEREPS